jgi:nicotinamidase/pyrazinamidase
VNAGVVERVKSGGAMRSGGAERPGLAGLALDYCVRYSAEDAQRQGFAVTILEDACRAIDVAGSLEAARQSFWERGIKCG